MTVAPTGLFSLPVDYLRKTVAGSSTFRTLTGAATPTAALAFIHAFDATGSDLAAGFYAVVEYGEEWARVMHAGGTNNFFDQEGRLQLWFTQAITEAVTSDAGYAFANALGAIISEMEQLSGTAGYLDIQEIRLVEGPGRPEEDEAASNGDFFRAMFAIEFRVT